MILQDTGEPKIGVPPARRLVDGTRKDARAPALFDEDDRVRRRVIAASAPIGRAFQRLVDHRMGRNIGSEEARTS